MKPLLLILPALAFLTIAMGHEEGILTMDINENLSHQGKAFESDSVLAVTFNKEYSEGRDMPVRKDGTWENPIERKIKLTPAQAAKFHAILGAKKTYKNPANAICYEPRLGLVFFKGGKVIAQTAICTTCMRLESTARLGNGSHGSGFNLKVLERLEKMSAELGF
jgi:hypothetical protein